MKNTWKLCAVLGALAMAPALLAQDVTYNYDKEYDFSQAKSYTWIEGTKVKDPLIDKALVQAIDAQLAAKGLKKVEMAAGPDLAVAYHVSVDEEKQVTGYSSSMGGWGGYRWGGGMGTTTTNLSTSTVLVGAIMLDIIDIKAKGIVWRGRATKEIDVKASPEKRDKNINKGTAKLLKNFPPPVKK
jgi:hypothetical protein